MMLPTRDSRPEGPLPGGEDAASVTYSSYLALDTVLGTQHVRSDEHDEMLFIVIHQVSAFRSRLAPASGFQSAQFRAIGAVLGARAQQTAQPYPDGSPERERIVAAMGRRSLFDSYVLYLATQGYAVSQDVLNRDVTIATEPSAAIQDIVLRAHVDDGGAAPVSERMMDLDEGMQEWRYRHVKMVERTIGDRRGTVASSGSAIFGSRCSDPPSPPSGRSATASDLRPRLSSCLTPSAPPPAAAQRAPGLD